MEACGLVFIVSAPSGAGKTTLGDAILETFTDIRRSISYTTRSPRGRERDGVDYRFVTVDVFEDMVRAGAFAEWAEVHGHRYGTALEALRLQPGESADVLLEIDIQGARQIKDRLRTGIYIFILPPSAEVLEARLRMRATEKEADLRRRLDAVRTEIAEAHWFDYIIVNDRLEEAVGQFRSIVTAERSRCERLLPGLTARFPDLSRAGCGKG